MLVTHIDNHVDVAVSRLLEQFKTRPRIEGLVAGLVTGQQSIEDAAYSLSGGRTIDAARGATLDHLGELVGIPRGGLDDETYRIVLRGTIAENHSDSSYESVLATTRALFGADSAFIHPALRGGEMGIGIGGPTVPRRYYELMLGLLRRAIGAGTHLGFVVTYESVAFSMAGPQRWVSGFGDAADWDVDAPPGGSINLLPPNVARCGDTLGNVDEWIPCTSGEAFGETTGGGGITNVTMETASAGGTALEGDNAVSVIISDGSGSPGVGDRYGAKLLLDDLDPETSYVFTFQTQGGLFGAQIAPEIYWSGGLIVEDFITNGYASSAFGFSLKAYGFTTPAGCTAVEMRIVALTDAAYLYRIDQAQLEEGTTFTDWVDPTPPPASTGGSPRGPGFGDLIYQDPPP